MKNMKNRFSDPDPDPDPLLPNMDPRIPIHFSQMWIRILIHVKMRWIRNAELKANLHLHPMLEAELQTNLKEKLYIYVFSLFNFFCLTFQS